MLATGELDHVYAGYISIRQGDAVSVFGLSGIDHESGASTLARASRGGEPNGERSPRDDGGAECESCSHAISSYRASVQVW